MLVIADSKIPHAEMAFKPFGEVSVVPTKQMTAETVRDAGVIFVRSETRIDSSLLAGSKVRFVGTATIGTDHVDEEYLKKNDIGFTSCPGSNANSVAEYVLAALLEVGDRLHMSLSGKTLGVVGHGNTGSRVAKKAGAIGMHVLLNDPPLARSTGDERYVPLDALMQADFLSLHVPLTKTGEDATFHLFDERRLSAMKEGSILLNCSRGAVVDNEAVKTILQRKHLQACVLDVWENEPKMDIALLQLVMLGTPHIAGYSYDGKLNATKMLRQALSDFVHRSLPQLAPDDSDQKEIVLPVGEENIEALLRSAVLQCYNINQDDERMRALITTEDGLRADFFRTLRSKYPVRREFHNYTINAEALPPAVLKMLSSIGFTINL